jgi:hypothetical protein
MDSNGLINELQKSLEFEINDDTEGRQIMKAFKLSGEAKIKGVIEYIETLLECKLWFC